MTLIKARQIEFFFWEQFAVHANKRADTIKSIQMHHTVFKKARPTELPASHQSQKGSLIEWTIETPNNNALHQFEKGGRIASKTDYCTYTQNRHVCSIRFQCAHTHTSPLQSPNCTQETLSLGADAAVPPLPVYQL